MRIVREDLEGDRIAELARFVLVYVELEELVVGELLACDGVCAMFFEPRDYVGELEDCTVRSTDRVLVGLEGEGAEVVRETFEGEGGLRLEAGRGAV
jgi:hypothetical protein